MSEYISKEAAKDNVSQFLSTHAFVVLPELRKSFDKIPSADVRENVHGEWIPYPGGYVCSNCRKKDRKTAMINMKAYQYCPDCGCKMRVRKESV